MSVPVKTSKPLGETLRNAAKKALGGGIPGAAAMVIQVLALMWMRTTINYQHANGMGTAEAMAALYAAGGIARFYQGLTAALLQAPLSRFGDTAANAGMLALLEPYTRIPMWAKTFCASFTAGLFRVAITPIDTFKTTLQVAGTSGLALVREKVSKHGILTLYDGAIGSSVATLLGHYPWFITYNFLQGLIPPASGVAKMIRSAVIGFCSSFTSDVVSNSVRVLKTAKQTSVEPLTYMETASKIIAQDGLSGIFFRGLGTKILSNGVQAMLFTILWRYFEEKLAAYNQRKEMEKKKSAD